MKLQELDKLLKNKTKDELINFILDNIELTLMEENTIDNWNIEALKHFINDKLIDGDDYNKYIVREMSSDNEQLDIMKFIKDQKKALKSSLLVPFSMGIFGLCGFLIALKATIGYLIIFSSIGLVCSGASISFLINYINEKKELKNLQLQYDTPTYDVTTFIKNIKTKNESLNKGEMLLAIKVNETNNEILNYIKELENRYNIKFIKNQVILSSLLELVNEESKEKEMQLTYVKRLLLKIFQYVEFNERNEVTLYDISYIIREGEENKIQGVEFFDYSNVSEESYTKKYTLGSDGK